MLTVKAPLEIKAKTSYLRDPESFYHRITGNYSLMETHVQEEDLLHIAATPPEIYVTEGQGISSVLSHSVRNENNYNKVEILNNVLNRIIVSADMDLTYQDRVFITDALYRLGIRDDRKFMDSFYRMATETRNTNNLINMYLAQGNDIKALVKAFETGREKEKVAQAEGSQTRNENYLYNTVLNRLSTGAVYQIVSNFNRSVDYNEIDKNEYSLSEQTYMAQNMLLSKMRERTGVSPDNLNLFLINENTYEGDIEETAVDVTNVKNDITGAVMMDILKNIYHAGYEKFYLSNDMYYRFEDTFYKSSDQTISRLINNFGSMVTRDEVENNLTIESNKLINNELMLFDFSRQSVITAEEAAHIEEILNEIDASNREISQTFEQYNTSLSRYRFEELPPEKKTLDAGALTFLQIVGEASDSETLQNISNNIKETVERSGNVYEVLSEYVSNIEEQIRSTEISNRLSSKTDIFELLNTIEVSEDEEAAIAAAKSLEKVIDNSDVASLVLNEYLTSISGEEISVDVVDEKTIRQDTLELVDLVHAAAEDKTPSEELKRIKEIIRGGEVLTVNDRELIVQRAVDKAVKAGNVFNTENIENIKKNDLLEFLGLTNITEENILRYDQRELTTLLESIEKGGITVESAERIKELIRQGQTLTQNERERILRETLEKAGEAGRTSSTENVYNNVKLELAELINKPEEGELSIESLEFIKNIIRSTSELKNSEKKQYLEMLTSSQIRTVTESKVSGKGAAQVKKELITLLEKSSKVSISKETNEKLTESLKELYTHSDRVHVAFETAEAIKEGEGTETLPGAKEKVLPKEELFFERTVETKEGESSTLVLNRESLLEFITRNSDIISVQDTQAPERVRDIIRQIEHTGLKQRKGYIEGEEGYDIFKAEEGEGAEALSLENAPVNRETVHEVDKSRVTDEDIRKITESVNKIDEQNEIRRRQYVEALKSIRQPKERTTTAQAMEKTRKLAALSLESPEKLMETLSSEQIVRETREKEILTQLKDIFPEQSLEIYQMLNKYQKGSDQFVTENIIRPADVGELIYDINRAGKSPEDEEKEQQRTKALADLQQIEEAAERNVIQRQSEEPRRARTPAETVHKVTETFSSDELNEQLQMMQHNITKTIKEDVSSEVVNESHHKNAKQIVTTDSSTEQINAVQLQRLIENSVQAEMNAISDKVIGKLERKMHNEKIRRGY